MRGDESAASFRVGGRKSWTPGSPCPVYRLLSNTQGKRFELGVPGIWFSSCFVACKTRRIQIPGASCSARIPELSDVQ